MKFELPHLILASGSPRRAGLLEAVGWGFSKRSADIDESEIEGESPEGYVCRLARSKAEKIASEYSDALVLGADTTVVLEGQIIGKPLDLEDAAKMLKRLSGKWHDVLTGTALVKVAAGEKEARVAYERTRVKFRELNDSEIGFLVRFGEPMDKAGAYAVQAQAALFIERIDGDYWNVTGLPVHLVYRLWQEF